MTIEFAEWIDLSILHIVEVFISAEMENPMRTRAKGSEAAIESLFRSVSKLWIPRNDKMECDTGYRPIDFRKNRVDFRNFIAESAPYAHISIAL